MLLTCVNLTTSSRTHFKIIATPLQFEISIEGRPRCDACCPHVVRCPANAFKPHNTQKPKNRIISKLPH